MSEPAATPCRLLLRVIERGTLFGAKAVFWVIVARLIFEASVSCDVFCQREIARTHELRRNADDGLPRQLVAETTRASGWRHGNDWSVPLARDVHVARSIVRVLHLGDSLPAEVLPSKDAPQGVKIYAPMDLPLILTEPIVVELDGRKFVLDREGMYRIGDFGGGATANTILSLGNVWRLAGHLSRLQIHGWRHSDENIDQWTERARTGRLSIACGSAVRFVSHHLEARGWRTRAVQVVTLEDHNGYDDGHVLMEVFDPEEQRWLLFDPDMKCRFRGDRGWLDLAETVALYRGGGDAELVFVAPPAIDSYAEERAPRQFAQFSMMFESTLREAAVRQKWYRRMFQTPVVDGAAGAWLPSDVARIRGVGATRLLSWKLWTEEVYRR
jgi:hypothetical protein